MKVVWNKKADLQWRQTTAYLAATFEKRTAEKFTERVKHWQAVLMEQPYIGQVESLLAGRRNVYRSLVIHKNCKLVYRIDEQRQVIRIAALWDTRREPRRQAGEV